MIDEVIVLGGGVRRGGGMSIFNNNMVLQEFINSRPMSYDVNYIIRDELSPEHTTCNEYFTPKKREIPSILFEALLKRIEND